MSGEEMNEARWQVTLTRIFIESARQRGLVVEPAERFIAEAERWITLGKSKQALLASRQARTLLSQSRTLRPGWKYYEPSDIDEIQNLRPSDEILGKYDLSHYSQDVTGSWLGLNIGSALGLSVENWSADRILCEIGEINDYVVKPPVTCNDDTTFQILSIHAIEEHGLAFTSRQLGMEWVEHIPFALTAEGVAINNLKLGLVPPATAIQDNPFIEWVGGAMKAEVWGLLVPGNPKLAVQYAFKDAIIAHQANGIYGALFVASLISLAFVERDLLTLLHMAAAFIPASSRLAELIDRCQIWYQKYSNWRDALNQYHVHYSEYDSMPFGYVHVFRCLAAAIIGFLYGEADFERSICIAAMCGGDTDFPPALIGSVYGLWLGESGLPSKWREPIGQEMDTMATGMTRITYSEIVQRICHIGRKIQEAAR